MNFLTLDDPHRLWSPIDTRLSPAMSSSLQAMIGLRIASALTLLVATFAGAPSLSGAAPSDPVQVDVVTSTADGTLHVATETRTITPGATVDAPKVQVSTDQPRQRFRGVGAALTESSAEVISQLSTESRHELLEALFSPSQGGLSVLRIPIGSSEFALELHSLDDSDTPDPDLTKFSIARDLQWVIPVLHEILAINPDIALVASPWSAPAWMKNSNNFLYGVLNDDSEDAFARYLVKFLQAYRAEGINVNWLTLQNEPASFQLTMPSMLMTADQQARIAQKYLGPDLAAAGLPTRVLTWDHNWCDAQPPGGCVGSGTATFPNNVLGAVDAAYPFAGTAYHCYGGNQAAADDASHAAWPNLELWQTECSGGTWQGDAFGDTARLILTGLDHWENASILWNLALDPSNGPHTGGCDTCRGVATVDPSAGTWNLNVDYDVLATTTHFAPQGSGALDTAVTGSGVTAAGICSPEGRPAAIILNTGMSRTVSVNFGDLSLPVDVPAKSLTSVRAPEGVGCSLAHWSALPEAPTATTTSTTSTTTTSTTTRSTTSTSVPESTTPTTVAPATMLPATSAPTTTMSIRSMTTANPAVAVAATPTYTG